jgi:hypothetical protein
VDVLNFAGITSFVGGRPKPTPCLKLFSFLYPKSKLDAKITMGDKANCVHNC